MGRPGRPKKKLSDELLVESMKEISKVEKELSIVPEEIDILTPVSEFETDKFKQQLEIKKKFAVQTLSGKKLTQALNLFTVIEQYGDILSDPDVFDRVKQNINDSKDLKFLVDSISELNDMVNTLMRPDTLDATGASKRINISIGYQDGTVKID